MDYDLLQLQEIYAPRPVAVPPVNATRELMQLPGGEIRHYHLLEQELVSDYFLASKDYGLSWKKFPAPPNCPGATVCSPYSGDFLTLRTDRRSPQQLLLFRSQNGCDGDYTQTAVATLSGGLACRQPLPLRRIKRWVLPVQEHRPGEPRRCPAVLLSDDDGYSWQSVHLPTLPVLKVAAPHQGVRWLDCGPEPTIAELADGRLMMLLRTAMDFYYQSFSDDYGQTWTAAEPSPFYGTITSPLLLTLSSGRLLFFGNLTQPLPELAHQQTAYLNDSELSGQSEDVFTNRDVLHAALSDDHGRTWQGFREIWLNPLRNAADFRLAGGRADSNDRSVHQAQALELPDGKILVACGQHPLSRMMLIFASDWLLEKERSDDFSCGLGDWSVHQYVKSRLGNTRGPATGHCAYNRRPGAALISSPLDCRECLQVARFADPRLIEERQGAVWNFPMAARGFLRLEFMPQSGAGEVLFLLHDHWLNPTDVNARQYACLSLQLQPGGQIGPEQSRLNEKNVLEIFWHCANPQDCFFRLNDAAMQPIEFLRPPLHGLNYLHIQSASANTDPLGVLIFAVKAGQR